MPLEAHEARACREVWMSRKPKRQVLIGIRQKTVHKVGPSRLRKKHPRALEEDYTPPNGMEHYLELADLMLRRRKAA